MSYIIVFWDKSKLQISDEMATRLMGAIQSGELKHFGLNQSLYSIAGVDKVITKEEARRVFPEDWVQFNGMEDSKANEDFAKLSNSKLLK